MESRQLRTSLDRLHQELEKTTTLDGELRQSLQTVLEDIHRLLGDEEAESHKSPVLLGKLREALDDLEGSHPTLATGVSEMVDVLGRMGL